MKSNLSGKWIGIDYGEARIGVAASDPMGILACGLETVRWNGRDMAPALTRIAEIVRENHAVGVVIGLPRRTDGKESQSENDARHFAAELARITGLEPVLLDERYTTLLATRIMRETGVRQSKRRAVVDQIAAEIILQEYLNSHRKG
ncbi:MAG: Holliday junction resolvase RuvX [Saccharofermentanales bacterium]|jgi:putative Holliday junction resolvase|nr:Holliday junction resolvase RuvX [Clostridiaceae bacterium]